MIRLILPRLLDKSFIKESMSMQVISMFMKCVNILEWFSNVQIHLPSLSTETLPLLTNVKVSEISKLWTRLLRHRLSKQVFGIRLKMIFINLPLPSQVVSSNVFVLQELLPLNRRFSSWTNLQLHWTL